MPLGKAKAHLWPRGFLVPLPHRFTPPWPCNMGAARGMREKFLLFLRRTFCPLSSTGQMADDPCLVGVQPRTLTNYPCELADIPGRPARAKASILGTSCLNLCACLMQGAGERSLLRATLGPERWCCGVSAWGILFVSNTSSTGVLNVSVTSSRTGTPLRFLLVSLRA